MNNASQLPCQYNNARTADTITEDLSSSSRLFVQSFLKQLYTLFDHVRHTIQYEQYKMRTNYSTYHHYRIKCIDVQCSSFYYYI